MSPHENSAGEERADEWGRMQGSTSWSGMESGRQGRYATRRDWIITNWDERAGTRSEGGAAWRRTREQGQATDMSGSNFPKKWKTPNPPKNNDITPPAS